jgi:hypothetical protein
MGTCDRNISYKGGGGGSEGRRKMEWFKLRWLEDVENDLLELRMTIWKQK